MVEDRIQWLAFVCTVLNFGLCILIVVCVFLDAATLT